VKRGGLTLWVREAVRGAWHDDARTGRLGAPRTYSNTAIMGMVWLSAGYRLTQRTTQGLMASGLKLLEGCVTGATLNDLVSAALDACSRSTAACQRRTVARGGGGHGCLRCMVKASGRSEAMEGANGVRGANCT
jgi:Transposase DDE domain